MAFPTPTMTLRPFFARTPMTAAGVIGALLLVPACTVLRPKPDPSRHYVLRSLAAESGAGALVRGQSNLVLGVGPIVLPDYLKRSEFVTSKSPNEVVIEEFFLWGEDLDRGIAQVLSTSVARYTGSSKVAPFPEVDLGSNVPRVAVIVRRFEPAGDGSVLLSVHWAVVDSGVELGETEGTPFELRVPMNVPPDASAPERVEAGVTAMSEALDQLAREIVRKL